MFATTTTGCEGWYLPSVCSQPIFIQTMQEENDADSQPSEINSLN